MEYGYRKRLNVPYEQAVERMQQSLKEQGFGVLCEIDVAATIKKKLDVDFGRRYVILGACNPHLAYEALQAERELGLLLPCNVIVYEDGDESIVAVIDPKVMMGVVENEKLSSVAERADALLKKAIDAV